MHERSAPELEENLQGVGRIPRKLIHGLLFEPNDAEWDGKGVKSYGRLRHHERWSCRQVRLFASVCSWVRNAPNPSSNRPRLEPLTVWASINQGPFGEKGSLFVLTGCISRDVRGQRFGFGTARFAWFLQNRGKQNKLRGPNQEQRNKMPRTSIVCVFFLLFFCGNHSFFTSASAFKLVSTCPQSWNLGQFCKFCTHGCFAKKRNMPVKKRMFPCSLKADCPAFEHKHRR